MVVFKKFGILLMIFYLFDSYSFIVCAAAPNKSGKPVVSPPIARTLAVGGTFSPNEVPPKVLPPKVPPPKAVPPKLLPPKVLSPKVLSPKVLPPMVLPPKVLPHELKNTSLEDPIVFFPQPFAYPGYPVVVYL